MVCLCGSTRFSHAFREANLRETLAGRIVLSIGCDMRSDADLFAGLDQDAIERIKANLDELHKRKIDLSDEVLVLNVGGYIGDSTRSEIEYARWHGKAIRYLEPTIPQDSGTADPDRIRRMTQQQKPSINRAVHYVSYGTPGGEYPSVCRAATITEVDPSDERRVGLAVLNPTGMFFHSLAAGGCVLDDGACKLREV